MIDWIVPEWPAPSNVRSLITTRSGGFSSGVFARLNLGLHVDDDPQAVRRNRALLREFLPGEPRWLLQVHGTRVVEAQDVLETIHADGSYTSRPGIICAVLTADCLPVLLCDDEGTRVAIAHAGWRGLSSGVLEAVVGALAIAPQRLLAYFGPAIGPQAFEVGALVRDAFTASDPEAATAFIRNRHDKWLADLYLLATQRLHRLGVKRVFGGGYCTYSDPARFFSYRRERATGRMASLIWLTRPM
jgi:YfiH family protein